MRQEWDAALVRHVYDVYCIHALDPTALARAIPKFTDLMNYDVSEFGIQYPAFAEATVKVLSEALVQAEVDVTIHREYELRLLPLIFGSVRPTFPVAYATFRYCSETLLGLGPVPLTCPHSGGER